jgi:hypothetical protein
VACESIKIQGDGRVRRRLPPAPMDPLHQEGNGFPRALDKQTDAGRSSTAALEAGPFRTLVGDVVWDPDGAVRCGSLCGAGYLSLRVVLNSNSLSWPF